MGESRKICELIKKEKAQSEAGFTSGLTLGFSIVSYLYLKYFTPDSKI